MRQLRAGRVVLLSVMIAASTVEAADDTLSPGIHLALNLGVAADLHRGAIYGFASANFGLPAVAKAELGYFAIGLGTSLPLSSTWSFDLYALASPGWMRVANQREAFIGLGAGAGFRFVHPRGFVFGLKFPLFGAAFGPALGATPNVGFQIYTFYYSSLFALPTVSLGYRF